MRRNLDGQFVSAVLISRIDGSSVTAGTTTVYVTGDAGTQSAGSPATHEGNGLWSFAPSAADTNYSHVSFLFIHDSAVPANIQVYPTSLTAGGDTVVIARGIVAASPTPTIRAFTLTGFALVDTPISGTWIGQHVYNERRAEFAKIDGHIVSGTGPSATHAITLGSGSGVDGPLDSAPIVGQEIVICP